MTPPLSVLDLPNAPFGGLIQATDGPAFTAAAEANAAALLDAFYARHGLLLVRGLKGLSKDPALLLRWKRVRLIVPCGHSGLPNSAISIPRNIRHKSGRE